MKTYLSCCGLVQHLESVPGCRPACSALGAVEAAGAMEVDQEMSIMVIIPEGEAPPAVMPVTFATADTVAMLKKRIDEKSAGQRPAERMVLLSWGQELEDSAVVSQLADAPQSLTLVMKSDLPLSALVPDLKLPADPHAAARDQSTNAIVQMLRQLQDLQPRR